ncbi:hypothetical protein ATK17_0007 [Branchiibius hedensis]|uniref:Uncharacterized protein n=1 Tax=Branchiibius hedensis TaxID=672460 RepID=A0A2Y8ZLW1_9MICO|nr:hypothetical protein [Branchiibius hedensis]PWJ22809.1 hypothetical protein ATK17_3979 [Branchiibius hedensis]PWJ23926.1 hypothetical protein ATK17_0007 [Branchiibius hedensis]SSA32744.1 hypothetical protein SAMN04489750_0007 [Branchiibius hedensis]SSA59158.1 hypothetical protein SAMN04489750_3979 [Branchiibius hedensis]
MTADIPTLSGALSVAAGVCVFFVAAGLIAVVLYAVSRRSPTRDDWADQPAQYERSAYVPDYDWAAAEDQMRAPYDWKETGL